LDDSGLAARLRAGETAAFEELFRAYHAPLCTFVHGFVDSPAIAEDIVQSIFLSLWTGHERLEFRTSLRAYLFGAARNRALDHLKRGRVERRWAEAAQRESDAAADVHDVPEAQARLESEDLERALREAVARLPERAQLVVALRWQQGLSHAEIAEALGISVKGVEIQITRALRALREILGGN
jgi:RNA polymerase sigma-70 factor (ECF subfamily)